MTNSFKILTHAEVDEMANEICASPDNWKAIIAQEQSDEAWHQEMAKDPEFRSDNLGLMPPQKQPSILSISYNGIEQRYGDSKNVGVGALVLELRRRARVELGLPI